MISLTLEDLNKLTAKELYKVLTEFYGVTDVPRSKSDMIKLLSEKLWLSGNIEDRKSNVPQYSVRVKRIKDRIEKGEPLP